MMADRDYTITDPGGREITITGPDNASPAQLRAAAEKAFGAAPADREKAREKADRELYSPTKGMSGPEKFAAGAGKAVADTGRGIAGLFGADNADAIKESRQLDSALMDTGAGMAGNATGHIAMALTPGVALKGTAMAVNASRVAPVAVASRLNAAGNAMVAPTSLRGAAALGGAVGLVQPAVDTGERATNVGLGAAASAGGQAAFNGLARIVRPNTSPQVRNLLAEGITPTPGQILGGGFKRAEEGLSSLPIVGDAIKRGQTRAAEDMNTAAFNRALKPVGETLPKGLRGREAVEHVGDVLGARYDALLPQMTARADQQFATQIGNLQGMVANGAIDPNAGAAFERFLQNNVIGKFQGQGAITGETIKAIESDLTQTISRLGRSTDADQRLVADALMEVQDGLRDLVTRNNPQHAAELKAINTGYANFKRVQRAAASLGAEDGVFGAAQLQSAVKAGDRSKDKARFARGNALMQDLSEPAKAVLGNKLPDSGTPYRAMLGAGVLTGGAGYFSNMDPLAMGGAAAIPLAFSRPGQNALAAILARRPASAEPVANALRRIAPYAALPAVGTSDR